MTCYAMLLCYATLQERILALAEALPASQLCELKLANQKAVCSQAQHSIS